MKLKSKITAEEHAALSTEMKAFYLELNGSFVLDTDEAEELRRAKQRVDEERRAEKERADRLQTEKDEAEAALRTAAEETARKKGDVAAIEASWQKKLNDAVKLVEERATRLQNSLSVLLVDNKAMEIAGRISTVPALILPYIKGRLAAELDGEMPTTRVLVDGKPSALNIADFEKELIANPDFAPIIKASDASGGGAGGGRPGGGATGKKFSEMTSTERDALRQKNPAEFQRMASENASQNTRLSGF